MSEAHKLKEVVVEGFKSVRSQRVAIGDLNVLIGPNGSGKSNFIGLFKFVRNIIEERLQVYTGQNGGADRLLHYGFAQTKRIHLAFDFSPNRYEIALGVSVQSDRFFVEMELGHFDHGLSPKGYREFIANPGAQESGLLQYTKANKYGVPIHVYNVIKSWRVYHFHDTSENAGVKKYASISDYEILFDDGANLAPVLYIMKQRQPKHYDRIVKIIQLVVPFFKDFVLRPNPLNERTILLEWQDLFSDRVFTAAELSDGSLRFICLATLLLQPELPKMILLDEPELGLHPSAIEVLGGLLQKAAYRTQVIVSTQSTTLVSQFKPEEIIIVERQGDATVFNRLNPERLQAWLTDYSLGDLWQKNVLGGKP